MEDIKQIYDKLIVQQFSEWELVDKAIEAIGALIDISFDLSRIDGFNHAIDQAKIILSNDIEEQWKSTLYYFIGNAWSGLRYLKHNDKSEKVWDWEQGEIEQEIYNYRLSILYRDNPAFCQVHTNLANVLSHVGRFVEAIFYWDKTLEKNSNFGMALANKGRGLVSYAESLYDSGHQGVFLKFAYAFLKKGIATNEMYPAAKKSFEDKIQYLEKRLGKEFLNEPFDMDNYPLGEGAEKEYRKWCLSNRLFLNPLNDLGNHNIAARDILTCPNITTSVHESGSYPPGVFAFYNQLKQEYVSARYFLYESLNNAEPHFSDKDVHLYNTLDYPCYGLNTEKAKISFRMIYSIFDKIAYFLNEYLDLGINERNVSFKTIWYDRKNNRTVLKEKFKTFQNWPLRGLFWIAKDLSENNDFKESIEPDAQDLVTIRNYLEHKFLTVTEYDMSDLDFEESSNNKIYRIEADAFSSKALKLLRLAREALIYLSLGVHIEERKKNAGFDGVRGSMFLDTWEDDWKK